MEFEIELYGGLRQRAGADEVTVNIDEREPTVGDVVAALQREVPSLDGMLQSVARAVDDELVGDEHVLEHGDVVALLPPVSGGSPTPYLSPTPLQRDRLIAATEDGRCGALVVFSGDVRNHNEGRDDVVAIEYEAHQAMASRVLETVEAEVAERFEVHSCRIQHRIGRVEVGESSVLVVCRGPHRDGAFEGARYAIDELKKRTPIWKREIYENGESRYLDGTPLRETGAVEQ